MSDVNAYDPKSWGDEQHAINEARYEPGGDLGPDAAPPTRPRTEDRDLAAQLDDLRDLARSTSAQMEKAYATAAAAEIEHGRLMRKIADVERQIDELTFESEG